MVEQANNQPNTPRLVNADVFSTQELRGLKLAKDQPNQGEPTAEFEASPQSSIEVYHPSLVDLAMKAFVTIFAATTLFALVAIAVLATVVPPWYQGLTPRYQVIWCNRVEALCDLQPTLPSEDVLALDNGAVDADAALALLEATPTPESTVEIETIAPTPTLSPKGSNNLNNNNTAPAATEVSAPPTVPPTPTPQPTALSFASVASLDLSRLDWEEQGWNNCGPTTITIGLSFYGYAHDQKKAVNFLKPNIEDKNVSPAEMTAYVNEMASQEAPVRAIYRIGGSPELLKALIDADFPVVIERGIDVVDSGWMGHYSLVVGYDDTTREYLLFDSYFGHADGAGRREPQDAINQGWKSFNHTFIVIYDPARETQLNALLAGYTDPAYAATVALDRARQEATANPDDKWAWFNMGTALTELGRYQEAVLAFDRARTLQLPFRMLWYQFAPYEAYYQVGRYDDVLALTLANERQTPYVEETYYYRGLVYAAQGDAEEAIRQFDRALSFNRNFTAATEAKQAVLEGRFTPPANS